MWITYVGGKFRHGLLEKSLSESQFAGLLGGKCRLGEPCRAHPYGALALATFPNIEATKDSRHFSP